MKFYKFLLPLLVLDVVSAMSGRYAYNHDDVFFLLVSMLSLATAGYFFIKLLDYKVAVIVNIIWIALGAINVTLAGYLFFREEITLLQGMGMAVIVLGLGIVEYFGSKEVEAGIGAESDPAQA